MRFQRILNDKRLRLVIVGFVIALLVTISAVLRTVEANRNAAPQPQSVHVDQVARLAKNGEVDSITLNGDTVVAKLIDGTLVMTRKEPQSSMLETLRSYGVSEEQLIEIQMEIQDPAAAQGNTTALILASGLAILFVGGLVFVGSRTGGAGRYGSFTRSGARRVSTGNAGQSRSAPPITFENVAGVEEAKQELQEVVEFLKNPHKFTALGATIPKGVLLVGPPGTGKTLLSKAVAGEAGVPFFSISGSEFVEMFVGVGASRVRDLFSKARKAAPCIVFIDEIDAVGRHRGSGIRHGGNDEREQTLNQILVEMDGFDGRTGVVVIAATNRPDILDEALLRPGRFDRQVTIDSPDVKGRRAILAVHARGKPLDGDVDLEVLAKQTPGFSGADLANMMNEAAILAARRDRKTISMADLEEAIDRSIAGPQKRSRVISLRERRITAYHEVGHALVATLLPQCDSVHKVTIIGRGRAGGFTRFLPAEDRSLWTRSQFMDTLAAFLGGHVAEELTFGEVTTGASNDIERATEVAQRMVCQYGMSKRFGPVALSRSEGSAASGRSSFEQRPFSDDLAREIDQEIRGIIDEAREKARELLAARRSKVEEISELLLERETLDGDEFRELLGEEIPATPTC
jgi:cell division protease FtsH